MLISSQSGIDPEDVAQEAFIDAYRKRHTFRNGSKFRPWLYGIAVNRCLDHIRHQGRHQTSEIEPDIIDQLADQNDHPSDDPVEILINRQEISQLERGVASLPPKLRAVLTLRYLDDMQYEEIAEALQMPVGTVKTNLFRARAELRGRMENAQQ
jgi:RNA polymerase sigma-70 factor (ECF subfamily)